MRARELDVMHRRRLPLLAFLVAFCLLGLTGAADAPSTAVGSGRGDAIVSVQSHVGLAARTVTDRLTSSSSGRGHHPTPTSSLAVAVLGALLLTGTAAGRRRIGVVPQAGLLTAAGRGPPLTS